jgi:hypothetical protein
MASSTRSIFMECVDVHSALARAQLWQHAFSVIRGAGQGNGPANFTHAPRRDVVSTG